MLSFFRALFLRGKQQGRSLCP